MSTPGRGKPFPLYRAVEFYPSDIVSYKLF